MDTKSFDSFARAYRRAQSAFIKAVTKDNAIWDQIKPIANYVLDGGDPQYVAGLYRLLPKYFGWTDGQLRRDASYHYLMTCATWHRKCQASIAESKRRCEHLKFLAVNRALIDNIKD
jgi:hypothetical protein